MYRRHFVALMALAPLAGSFPALAQSGPAGDFARLSKRYLDGMARLHPGYATALGNHAYDDQVEDLSAAGRARDAEFLRTTLTELSAIPRASLSRDDQVDAALLDNDLRYQLWTLEVLQPFAWDPQGAAGTISGGLYALAARDFAPWPQRLRAATKRMEAVPAMFAQMRESIVPARVPAIYATTVAKQNAGILQIVDTMLSPHKGTLSRGDRVRFDRAVATLRTATAEQQRWLDGVLVPAANGEFRLRSELYDQKVKFALLSPLSRTEIKARAVRAAAETRSEMYQLARFVLRGQPKAPPTPAKPTPAQQQKAIEAALEMSYARRPTRSQVMDKARATLETATAFVREKKLVRVPTTPVQIIEMPKFQQGVAVAYCDSPGPLEKHLGTFYAVSPIPADWTDAQTTSFLREYNNYMIHDLSIHEAMPGHYLQIAHSNENKSVLRAVLSSGPFVEGWAVYAERLMADADYLDGDPLFKLTVLKMRMRSITNTLLDIGIHTEGLSEAQAMKLMMEGAFQQEREAAGKWTRARLGSTQLLSYFVGYSEHMDMRREAERRAGAKFDLMRYNDAAISHGSPPVRFVRALMFNEAIA
jgi:uncharacterized protein (DUF885 family)